MKTYYIEKRDKPKLKIKKYKIKDDNIYIYDKLEKNKNIEKIVKKFEKEGVTNIVLSSEIQKNKNFINAINANNIRIFDGRWLEKYLIPEILEYIINNKNIKKEECEIAVTTNEITDIGIETIKNLARQYKKLTVVTNHIERLKKIEKELYSNEGILIVISNNKKKSLAKSQIILNLDFNNQILNQYRLNENAVILNVEGGIKINSKRFCGLNINNYEIEISKEECIWRENMNVFQTKDLLEAKLYARDTLKNIRKKINESKVTVRELYGENGKIERFS